ncbi:MAG: hypothetical protein JW927_17255 [Deltaproteobacteria bacterium]|nr:hypothetical protein [Deltaproteobacteria bacterium]
MESKIGNLSDSKIRRERDYLEKYYNEKISKFASPELFNSYWAFYRL